MYIVTWTSQGGTLGMSQRFWTKWGARKFVRVLAESGRKGYIS